MISLRNLKKDMYRSFLEPSYAVNVLKKRFASYLSYRFNNVFGFPPESVTFFLTHRCNLRCKMCGQSKMPRGEAELSLEEFKKTVDEIAPFKPNITFYGGEPFLYSEIDALIRYIKSKAIHLCIITNGTLLDRYADTIVENNVDVISVSIDGPSSLHDQIRGLGSAFERIEKGIECINRIKKRHRKKNPIINIVCTISSFNYLHLNDVVSIAKAFNAATLNFHHLIFMDSQAAQEQDKLSNCSCGGVSDDWEGFISNEARDIDPYILTENINNIKRLRTKFLINFYPNFTADDIKRYYTSPRFSSKSYNARCLSPWMTAYVYPDGSIKPCLALDYAAGNIRAESFLKIWSSESLNRFRKVLKKEKCFPVCERCTELYRY